MFSSIRIQLDVALLFDDLILVLRFPMLQAIAYLFSPVLASCSCRLESIKLNLVKMLLLFAIGSSHAEGAGNEKEDFGN